MTKPLYLVSHGETPVQKIPGVFNEHSFRCPKNITIHFFETIGKQFIKNDAGLLCNLISRRNEEGRLDELLEHLDDKKFETPFATRKYYCKKYTENDIVPNILFKLKDPVTQLGLFHIHDNTHGPHFVEFDNTYAGPQWDIKFDADIDERILGPKQITHFPIGGGKPLFTYTTIQRDLSHIISSLSTENPGTNVDLMIISCRNFVSPKLDNVIAHSHYISAVEPNIYHNYNKLLMDYENIIRDCELAIKQPVRKDLETAVMNSKHSVNNDLNQLVQRLKDLVLHSLGGYEDFKNIVIKIALEDHLHKKGVAILPQETDLYIPDIPGNRLTRAHSSANKLKQSAGGRNNIYSKINCPITGKQISINTKRGRSIIENYSKYYKSQ